MIQVTPTLPGQRDIWAAYNALRACRSVFGLSSGALHSLQAILSFIPKDGSLTVFAKNETLAARAACAPRSLTRHITQLEACNLLRRKHSSNGKRYRVTDQLGDEEVYGIDVSPLVARLSELVEITAQLEMRAARHKLLRKRIQSLLHDPEIQVAITEEEIVAVKRRLRCKLSLEELDVMLAGLLEVRPVAEKMARCDGQNDCHLQESEKEDLYVGEALREEKDTELQTKRSGPHLSLEEIHDRYPGALAFSTEPMTSHSKLFELAWMLGKACGIPERLMAEICQERGRTDVALAVLQITENAARIRSPGAYFRSIFRTSRQSVPPRRYGSQAGAERFCAV